MEKSLNNRTQVGLTEIGSTIAYLPLETSSGALIQKINKVIFTESLIFVQSSLYGLMAFDKAGRFVRSYGRVGREPAEFVQMHDFCVSPDSSKVYILKECATCLTFDVDGEFLSTARIGNGAMEIIPFDDSTFVFSVPLMERRV